MDEDGELGLCEVLLVWGAAVMDRRGDCDSVISVVFMDIYLGDGRFLVGRRRDCGCNGLTCRLWGLLEEEG
jgi:hypothetical protein